MFHELTGGIELLREPVLGQCRYSNQETIDFLVEFEKTGIIPDSVSFPECDYEDTTLNICRTHAKRKEINAKYSSGIKVGDYCVLNCHYRPDYLKYHRFVCESIETVIEKGRSVKIVNGLFKLKDVELGYCLTTNALQGHTIESPVNIHEFEKMSREGQYVALSRVRDLSQIRMDTGDLQVFPENDNVANTLANILKCH